MIVVCADFAPRVQIQARPRISPSRLAVGLNQHVRNAYSHEYYRVLDHGRVSMHDVNPRSGKIV